MFCSRCGQEIPEGTKFCGNCGADNSVSQQLAAEANEAVQNVVENVEETVEENVVETVEENVVENVEENVVENVEENVVENVVENAGGYTEQNTTETFEGVKATISNNSTPVRGMRLDDNRSFLTFFLLSLITCGIYGIYYFYQLISDVNVACDGDGESFDTSIAMFYVLTYVTCGIYLIIAYYKVCQRLYNNAPRYGLEFKESGTTFLLWYFLGAFLCCVGPYYAQYFIIKNSNAICGAYNAQNGL